MGAVPDIRFVTIATTDFRPLIERLLNSLHRAHPSASVDVYVDDPDSFQALPHPRSTVHRVAGMPSSGVKRAKFSMYADALRRGSFIYLDADVVVLRPLDELAGDPFLTACPDDLSGCPFIADPRYPWPGAPELENRRYVNSGVLHFGTEMLPHMDDLKERVSSDEFWDRHIHSGGLYDNHVLCAYLNLTDLPVRLVSERSFNWQGFRRPDGRLCASPSGPGLVNDDTAEPLHLVHFAGIRDIDQYLAALPGDISECIEAASTSTSTSTVRRAASTCPADRDLGLTSAPTRTHQQSKGSMPQEADDVLHEYLLLKDEVERQRRLIDELTRPRHWTQEGPRGAQATAVHHALDQVLERAVRVRNVVRPKPPGSPYEQLTGSSLPADDAPDRFYTRMRQAADLLGGPVGDAPALDTFMAAAQGSSRMPEEFAWLGLVAALGRYPHSTELDRAARAQREGGLGELGAVLDLLHLDAVSEGTTSSRPLGIRTGAVVIDVTHTARYDLHTGIQRVVREVASRWLNDPRSILAWWDEERGHLRELGSAETYRFRNWSDFLPKEADSEPAVRDFDGTPDAILVPWESTFLLPELAADHDRSSAYCALVLSHVVKQFGAIGFDLVPVAAAETVHEGMVSVFNRHVSVIKHADRLSAISASAANEFRSMGQLLEAQGLRGPSVEAHSLPPTPFAVTEQAIDHVRGSLRDRDLPVVLVVGSREPRKNQIAVLEAARRLFVDGQRFCLVMVGGSGWNSTDIDDEIDRLRALGLNITIRTRATETELFAWYRIARFSVFPSLYEGYGLPIAESLWSGTPVITSDYGSMSEIASLGGALMVNPRDPAEVHDAMALLLTDDELLAKLKADATNRSWPTWDRYAQDVWDHLVGLDPSTS